MISLLEAIQKHPDTFIYTLQSRASTTPSKSNKRNHMLLAAYISEQDWEGVSEILLNSQYRSALRGVVICLNMDYDFTEKGKIITLFTEERFV
ncbi:conserved hypothetical protein [Vibrio phage 249E41-1]|nr:conserved hypothetical protein [Vibrio phage 249E41-1]